MTTPQPAALPELPPLTGDILIEDRTIYVLNKNGENVWWATVYPGFHDNGIRVSDDQCRDVAADLARLAALQPQPAARNIATEMSLMVLCAVKDLPGLHANMLKDIDSAIEANRAALQPAAAVSDEEWWHGVLGSAGSDLLNLAKQWSDNEVHVYQFVNEAEKIVKAAAQRAILALRPQAVPMTPLPIFSHGTWVFQETGEAFTGAQLDAEAFVKYRAQQAVPMTDADVPEHVAMLDARDAFEAEATDSFGFKRSARGTYANPAVARDWKWFQLGARHARKGGA